MEGAQAIQSNLMAESEASVDADIQSMSQSVQAAL
jgi:hypothetical protein